MDVSPLITPPVTVHGTNSAGGSTSWTSSIALAASWDGGAVAYPTYVPGGDTASPQRYTTSQNGQYPNATAPLTQCCQVKDPPLSPDGLGERKSRNHAELSV